MAKKVMKKSRIWSKRRVWATLERFGLFMTKKCARRNIFAASSVKN
jgi:hypothetical protein